MNRIATAALIACTAASPVLADSADDVLKVVVPRARQMVVHNGIAPAVFSTTTRGGAMRAVEEWVWNTRPGLLASELTDDYFQKNQTEHEIASGILPSEVRSADLRKLESGHAYDWTKFSEQFPRARSVVVFSQPAFDALGKTAIVRVDVLTPSGGYMALWDLELNPTDGAWKMKNGSMHPLTAMYGNDIHSGHMPKQCPVPPDKRHPYTD